MLLLLPVIILLVSNGTAGRPVDATKLRNRPSDCETYVEMLARMSATAQVEYYKYHGLAVPGAVVSVKAVSTSASTAFTDISASVDTTAIAFHAGVGNRRKKERVI